MDAVEKFSQKLLKVEEEEKEKDPRWAARAAAVYFEAEKFDQATARYRTALELEPTNWKFSLGLAEALFKSKKHEESVTIIDPLVQKFRNDSTLAEENEASFAAALKILGDCQFEAGKLDEAFATYREAVKLTPDDLDIPNDYINRLHEKEQPDELFRFLKELQDQIDSDGLSRLVAMYLRFSSWPDFHESINEELNRINELWFAKESYQIAIAAASDDSSRTRELANLRYQYGLMLAQYGEHNTEQVEEACTQWEQNVAIGPAQKDKNWSVYYTCTIMTVRRYCETSTK